MTQASKMFSGTEIPLMDKENSASPKRRPFVPYPVFGLILLVAPFLFSTFTLSLVSLTMIWAIFAMSLDILIGYTGLYSFGHATFWGVAAYTVAIMSTKLGIQSFWINLVAGVSAATLVGIAFGPIVLRTSQVYFLMLTFALGQILYGIAIKWRSLTGGSDGLSISRLTLGFPWEKGSGTEVYYLVLVFFVCTYFALQRVAGSRFGRTIVGIRESEARMELLGYNTWLYKYVAYVLAGAVGGIAGCLSMYYQGFVCADQLNWPLSGEAMMMVIIGGAGTPIGPIVGAAVVLLLNQYISTQTVHWPLIIGAIFVFVVMYYPRGISPFLFDCWDKLRGFYVRIKS